MDGNRRGEKTGQDMESKQGRNTIMVYFRVATYKLD